MTEIAQTQEENIYRKKFSSLFSEFTVFLGRVGQQARETFGDVTPTNIDPRIEPLWKDFLSK